MNSNSANGPTPTQGELLTVSAMHLLIVMPIHRAKRFMQFKAMRYGEAVRLTLQRQAYQVIRCTKKVIVTNQS